MEILVLGSGGREHTLVWKLAQSSLPNTIFVAPGNAGTSAVATNVDLSITDFDGIKQFVLDNTIEMVVVGPEVPLVEGIHDTFLQEPALRDVCVIGPQKLGATLEGSKAFAKEFMARHNIPTAAYQRFSKENLKDGHAFLETLKPPYVLKADGLAAGKGVLIIDDMQEAKKQLTNMLVDAKFGEASETVVIEEFLDGIELSCFVLTDGNSYKILPMAKDYKRIGEGDAGLNTGGMGAISPVPFVDEQFLRKIEERVVKPTVEGLKKDDIPYVGFIFIGLIKVAGDEPKVIEYNVRMGDPETEVVFPRIKNDLVEVFQAVAEQRLHEIDLVVDERAATTVIAVSGGYPEAYEKGKEIQGLDTIQDSLVFHAGTKKENEKVLSNGGRVLAITSLGNDFKEALKTSYSNLKKVEFEGMYYRKDIGFDL